MTGGRYARCAGPHPTTTSPSPVTRAAPRAVDPARHPQPLRLRRHSLDTEQYSGQTFTSGSTVKIEPAQPLRHARLPAPQFQARDHRTNKPSHSTDGASAKSACTLPEVVTGGGTCTCVKPPYTTSELHRCWPAQYTRNIAANPVPVEAEAAVPREARAAGHRGGAGPAADRGHPSGHSREGVVARARDPAPGSGLFREGDEAKTCPLGLSRDGAEPQTPTAGRHDHRCKKPAGGNRRGFVVSPDLTRFAQTP